jgi:hypothetical protein
VKIYVPKEHRAGRSFYYYLNVSLVVEPIIF